MAALLAGGDGVDGVEVGLGRGLDDVGRGGPAAVRAVVALDLQLERHLALRVLALGHAPDDELVQVGVDARDPLDGLEDRVDRAVADGRVLDDLAVGAADGDRGRRQDAHAGRRVQADELPVRRDVLQVLLDQDDQVLVVHFLLLVGQRLEVVEQRLELLVGQGVAHLGDPLAQGMAAGVLAQDQVGPRHADVLGPHDLVGRALLEHAVLVDARLVGEGVAAHDRLVALDGQAGDRREHPADRVEPLGLDAGRQAVVVEPGLQGHDDLFERGVAGALADAVDRALDLPGAGLAAGQAVGDGHAQVVVAVGADDRPVDVGHALLERADDRRVLERRRVADGVRDVHRRGAGLDGGLDDLAEEVELGPRGVLGAELDVRATAPWPAARWRPPSR